MSLQVRMLSPINFAEGAGVLATAATAIWFSGREERELRGKWQEYEQKNAETLKARAERAYIEPREIPWTLEELALYDGRDPDGPLLIAADGIVFNVWRGRQFYLPGAAYHAMVGRDATQLLARNSMEEEEESSSSPPGTKHPPPLNLAQRASLAAWLMIYKEKYEVVGRLKDTVSEAEDVEPVMPQFLN